MELEPATKVQRIDDEKENRSATPTFDNAPACSIDVAALKPSRFLIPGPPPRLPFRDEVGRVNIHLLRASAAAADMASESRPAQLDRWLQHAERWLARSCTRTWVRGCDGVWTSSDGERRTEVDGRSTSDAGFARATNPADSNSVPAPAVPSAPRCTASCNAMASTAATPPAGFDMEAFERDGFTILRGVVHPDECQRFMRCAVTPALHRAGIHQDDPATWRDEETGDELGAVVRAADGGWHPIPLSDPESQWPALFGSRLLRGALDTLHGAEGWAWQHGASEGLGWIHIRFPSRVGSSWQPPASGWHIDGDSDSIDGTQSVVVLPLVTEIRSGGGGTALLRGSHRRVARLLHDSRILEYRLGEAVGAAINCCIVAPTLARALPGSVVEASGSAGDVLLMHPLLVHAASDAMRSTCHAGSLVRHGLRVTFNLSTCCTRPPLRHRDDGGIARRCALERTLLRTLREGLLREEAASQGGQAGSGGSNAGPQAGRLVHYNQKLEVRSVGCGRMVGVGSDGAVRATHTRLPPRASHAVELLPLAGGRAGQPVCYGDAVTIACRPPKDGGKAAAEVGGAMAVGMDMANGADNSRFTVTVSPAGQGSAAIARGEWTQARPGAQTLFRIEGHCDMRGVPLRFGGRFFLRTLHCVRDAWPDGCHLEVDPEQGGGVSARRLQRGEAQALVALRPAGRY